MDITFRNAVMISLGIHAAVVLPLGNSSLVKEQIKKEMIVDYVIMKETLTAKEPVRDVALKIPETPKVELKPKIETSPAPIAPTAAVEAKKDASSELAKKQARIKTTKDYISYYQLIREKIRRNLKTRYRNSYGEGSVALVFVLNANGTLQSADINDTISAKDQILRGVALSSLNDAAPFTSFPKGLSVPQMPFTITISFKKDR